MIITRTPFRISLFGGGTDYPIWFRKHGGCVLGAAIDKYCWITVRPTSRFGPRYKIIYSRVEERDRIDDICHPAARECLRYLNVDGCEIYHTSDLPARSGIGSSSAFVVGLLSALHKMRKDGDWLYGYDDEKLYKEAIRVEREILKENVGCQDQVICTLGGVQYIHFGRDDVIRTVEYSSVLPQLPGESWPWFERSSKVRLLEPYLMLFYTGIQRISSDVTGTYVNEMTDKQSVMEEIQGMPDLAVRKIMDGDAHGIGPMLHRAWELKKQLSPNITTSHIDAIYEKAMNVGATGGKLLGGGGGGFMLFFVPPPRQAAVREALLGLIEVPFHFCREGTKIYGHK